MKARPIVIVFIIIAMAILIFTWVRVQRTETISSNDSQLDDRDFKIKKLNKLISIQHEELIQLKKETHLLKQNRENGGGVTHEPIKETTSTQVAVKDDDYLKDPQGRYVDFLISVRFIHCSVKLSVVRINAIFNPRRIIFMSYEKDNCLILRGFAPNVHCIWEREILPSFTPDRFKEMVDEAQDKARLTAVDSKLPDDIGSFKDRAGWFFLQMINLGAGRYLKDLSENFVVWDSDIVPLSKEMKFWTDDGKIIRYTQKAHGHTVGIGYHDSYEKLFGRTMIHPDGKKVKGYKGTETWVAHQMIFTKSHIEEFLSAIEKHRGVERDMWPEEVVKVAMSVKGHEVFGFADYDHYGSFTWEEHPEQFHVMMGSYTKFTRPTRPSNYKSGTCCMPKSTFDDLTNKGLYYIVNEIHKGDVPICRSMNYHGLYHRDLPVTWMDDEDESDSLMTK